MARKSTTYLLEQIKLVIRSDCPEIIDLAVLGGDITPQLEELSYRYSYKLEDIYEAIDSLILDEY